MRKPRRHRRLTLALIAVLAGCAAPGGGGADLVPEAAGEPVGKPVGEPFGKPFLARVSFEEPAAHWRLPKELGEISGLTHTDAVMLTHHDNDSTLWVLDLRAGTPAVTLLPGQPGEAVKGDFEGVSSSDGMLYLLGSQGTLLGAPLRAGTPALAGALAPIPTGVEGRCNFEGLAAGPGATFYVACKYPRQPLDGSILLYRLHLEDDAPPEALVVDVSTVLASTGFARLRPSGLAWLPEQERLLVLVGKERLILELGADGTLLAWRRLPRRRHRQAEGLSVTPDGAVVIVDEADGRAPTLSLYR